MASINGDIRVRTQGNKSLIIGMAALALGALALFFGVSFVPFTASADAVPVDTYATCHDHEDNDGGDGIDLKSSLCSSIEDNDIPELLNQSLATTADTATTTTLSVIDADNDLVYFEVTLAPAHGTLSTIDAAHAYTLDALPHVTYTPDAGYTGSDTFEIEVNDGLADEHDIVGQLATFNVTVEPAAPVTQECVASSSFDSFSTGSVDGQDGWVEANATYDQEVVPNTYGFASFGCKSLRISNAVTSGSFDWIYAPSAANEAGESEAQSGSYSGGTRQSHFEAQFDIASALPSAQQEGLQISVSPDRGDGARMSYLRFEDQTDGIHVIFYGYVTTTGFADADIATLDRAVPHTIKFSVDFADGASNDVVKIYIDGALAHTGGTWEDYFRFDPEQAGSGNQVPTVDSLIFQARSSAGTAPPLEGRGFLIDNVSITTSTPDPSCASNEHLDNHVCVANTSSGGGNSGNTNQNTGGGGPVVGSGPLSIGFVNTNPTFGAGGLVLGTSTEALPEACTPYLTSYLGIGRANAPEQVLKLQTFLNAHGASLPATGFFGPLTFKAVKDFQRTYAKEILEPWIPYGLEDHVPTGYVYKTTQRMINMLSCNGTTNIPMPQLP